MLFVAALTVSAAALPFVAGTATGAGANVVITNVTATPDRPAPGQQTRIETTIRNGGNSSQTVEITDVYVRHPDSPDDIARVEDLGTLSAGGEITVPLTLSFEAEGVRDLRVVVVGRQANGGHVEARYPLMVDVERPERPQIEVSTQEAVPGATRPVNVTLANGLDADIERLQLVASSPAVNFSVNKRVQARLAAGNTTTFQFPARVSDAGTYPVNVTLTYSEQGVRRRVSRTFRTSFEGPDNPGEVVLTDVRAIGRGSTVEISATAGNVGSSAVSGVVVSVPNSSKVATANYFVGSIDGSDFSSFTISTSVDGNVSSVPVEVRYVVGGVEKSFTTRAQVERAAVNRPTSNGGGPPIPLLVGAGVILVAAVGGVYLWRR